MRVAAAVGRLDAQRHLPTLARLNVGRLAVKHRHGNIRVAGFGAARIAQHGWSGRKCAAIPAHIHAPWHLNKRTVQAGRLHLQPEAQTRLVALGQTDHHAGHTQVAPFQCRVQSMGQILRGTPSGRTEPQQGQRQQGSHLVPDVYYTFDSYKPIHHKGYRHN
jgi:hypothetical protein